MTEYGSWRRVKNGLLGRRSFLIAGVVLLSVLAAPGTFSTLHPYDGDDPSSASVRTRLQIERLTGEKLAPAVVATVERAKSPVETSRRLRAVRGVLVGEPFVRRVVLPTGMPRDPLTSAQHVVVAAFFRVGDDRRQRQAAQSVVDRAASIPGVTLGGEAVVNAEANDITFGDVERAEALASPLVFLLSAWLFGSFVAATLPLVAGALSIAVTLAVLRLIESVTTVSVYAINMASALGLALAIDYALLMVSRFREELVAGRPVAEAVAVTRRTAGRTIVFSSCTVAVSLSALLVFPQRTLGSMAGGGALVAVASGTVALTVLPLLLQGLGSTVNALAPPGRRRASSQNVTGNRWGRAAKLVLRRPVLISVTTFVVLAGLGAPLSGLQTFFIDSSVLPDSTQARRVDATLRAEFPRLGTASIGILLERADDTAAESYASRLSRIAGIASVSAPKAAGRGRWLVVATTPTQPATAAGQRVASAVSALAVDGTARATSLATAGAESRRAVRARLPVAIALITLPTLALLFMLTGSLVLPLVALAFNALTAWSTLGILTAIFQHRLLEGVLGFTSNGALELGSPILVGALAFGLSTDYGVFLFSRIKEARDAGHSHDEAIVTGVARTGSLVTAAALLFCVAIGANATSQIVFLKMFAVGSAIAVLIDATVVRALLLPAVLALIGPKLWWAPARLSALHRPIALVAD